MSSNAETPTEVRDAVITAVRVFARGRRGGGGGRPERERGWDLKRLPPQEALVFDTETLGDPAQRLMIGVWRLYADPPGGERGETCTEEGFFYPDDLAERDPKGFEILRAYVDDPRNEADVAPGFKRQLKLWPVSDWVDKRLWRYGWDHRRTAHVVGFNLPFDMARVAPYWAPARKFYAGGWSLGLVGQFDAKGRWKDAPFARRLLMRSIDPRRTLFAWGKSAKEVEGDDVAKDEEIFWRPEAPFVDLHTLVFALTDTNHDLVSACDAFGDQWKKDKTPYGRITKRLLKYARVDVQHTATLYRNCLIELGRHDGVPLVPYALYSPATVGTAYLEAMGVERPMRKFDLDERIYGWSMAAFFGGRAEARIVRTPVPVTLVDAASMYPTVNALLATWRLMVAEHLEPTDVTDRVRSLVLADHVIERCFERAFWRDEIGVTLVELDGADGDILPVRAYWDPTSQDPGIGVNPFRYDGTLWYMLPDVLASIALSGKVPAISRAIRLLPSEQVQPGLHPVALRGGAAIDPADTSTDPFVAMVQERRQVGKDKSISKAEKDRLTQFLKITANSTAYGVLARFDRQEREGTVTVFGPDEEPSKQQVSAVEKPGPYCFPPVAATLTAAARLMLALLEREVSTAGGTYAFCDTDSLAIVATPRGGQVSCETASGRWVRALSSRQIREILARFDGLNPYEVALVPSLWDDKHGSLVEPVMCYAISAKRYALYREAPRGHDFVEVVDAHEESNANDALPGETILADWSEHGLGLYLDPTDPDDPARDAQRRRIWMRQAWEWILEDDPLAPLPAWGSAPALTRFTVSSPKVRDWFKGYDSSVSRDDRMRPGAFGLLARPAVMLGEPSAEARPARSYEADPSKWLEGTWYDRKTGRPLDVTTADPAHDPEAFARALEQGHVRIQTLGEVLGRYRSHPEHKSLGPDGGWVMHETRGLLGRRPVESAAVLTDLTGKEGNKLIERLTGEVIDPKEYRTDYGSRADRWKLLAVPVLRRMKAELGRTGVARVCRVDRRTLDRTLNTKSPTAPHSPTLARYLEGGVGWVEPILRQVGIAPGRDPFGVLWVYLDSLPKAAMDRICLSCGKSIVNRHPLAQYCGQTCKKRAHRFRRQQTTTRPRTG